MTPPVGRSSWRRTGLLIAMTAMGAGTVLVVLASRSGGAASSTLGFGSLGWRAAAAVLEHEGVEVRTLDRPLEESTDELAEADVLVLGFPWQLSADVSPIPLRQVLRGGGNLIVAYSGNLLDRGEAAVLGAFGIDLAARPTELPLAPLAARRALREGERHRRADGSGPPLRTPWLDFVPSAPSDAEALFVDSQGVAIAFRFQDQGGDVWVLPAAALANGYLENEANLGLLLGLEERLGRRWLFDEHHHGLIAEGTARGSGTGASIDRFLMQAGLVYLLVLLALGWRFGPPWPSLPEVEDSHRELLLGIGELHHRLGHHRDAARALVERATEYDRRIAAPADLEGRLSGMGGPGLVALARELEPRRS